VRVTDQILHNNALNNIARNLELYARAQQQVATGKRVTAFSDDPVAASTSLRAKIRIAELEQYGRNIDDAKLWMSLTDSALEQATDLLRSARDAAVAGANTATSPEYRQALASQVDTIIDQLIEIGNSAYGGRYIFAGQDTLNAPFAADGEPTAAVTYSDRAGADRDIVWEVGPADYRAINVRGDQVFGDGQGNLVFDSLIALRDNLANGEVDAISNDRLDEINGYIDQVVQYRGQVGTGIVALDGVKTTLESNRSELVALRSKSEDADMVKAITELQQRETVYQAALLSTARILQLGLVNYLG
jgi:flagellar hook-associated protein 3 FlgL